MRTLLIGKGGQVGWDLERLLSPSEGFAAVDYPEVDLADGGSIRACLEKHKPDLVVNAAAYTAVDRAESEPELAMAVNGDAPAVLAGELKKTGGALVHYSTDYVFDGAKEGPYTEGDAPNPLSVYGRTKLAGERAVRTAGIPHLLIRTSWIYGSRGHNFLHTILRLAREREELRIVSDQVGAPTWCRTVAEVTVDILRKAAGRPVGDFLKERGGLYHLTASGETSWHGFAREITDLDRGRGERKLKRLVPIPTADYPTPARRPLNSRLDCSLLGKTFGLDLPPWRKSLRLVMDELAGGERGVPNS